MIIFRWIKAIFTAIGIMIAYMVGGQGRIGSKEVGKGPRRFGVPGIALLAAAGKRFRLKHLAFLLLIPILLCGYGENSIFMQLLHNDTLVRIVYGALLSIPFIFFGLKRWLFAVILLPIAFSIRAGSLGQFMGMDILKEDFYRGGTLAGLIIFNIFQENT